MMNKRLKFSVAVLPALLLAMLSQSGCGLKGDLYLPDETAEPGQTSPSEALSESAPPDEDEDEDSNKKPPAGTDAPAPSATTEMPEDSSESK